MVRMNHVVLPILRKQGYGRIVNLSSVAGSIPIPFQTYYSASKAAINSYTMATANEVRPFGVQVCCVQPGDIRTGFTAARQKNPMGDDVYGGRIARSVAGMEKDEQNGMTPEQASMLETDKDGKAVDADLLSGCTIRVDKYRDAVAKACTNASALGAAKGDRVSLGVEAENASSDITATDDKDVNAEVDLTVVALTLDADGRVTSAIGDMAEPALTIAADGGVTAPDTVRSKLELGDSYGMRNASSLGKEWYEHSEGYCSYLKGKTEKEVADIPADGSDADLAALCTISIDALQKAAGDAFENAP